MGYVGCRKHRTFRLETDLTVWAVGNDPLVSILHLCFYQTAHWNFNSIFKRIICILHLKVKLKSLPYPASLQTYQASFRTAGSC